MKIKPVIALAVLLLTVLPLLAGCFQGSRQSDVTTTVGTDVTTELQNNADNRIWLVKDGKVECRVVVPENYSDKENGAYAELSQAVMKKTGCLLEVITDDVKTDKTANTEITELLLGKTNRNVTAYAAGLMRFNDYGAVAKDKSIAVYAPQDGNIGYAMKCLTEKLNYEEGGVWVDAGLNNVVYESYRGLTVMGTDISAFTIVYDGTAAGEYAAKQLSENLGRRYGWVPKIYACGEKAATENEILVGKTDRLESVELYRENSDFGLMTYAIKVIGKKLVIGGGGAYSLSLAMLEINSYYDKYASNFTADINEKINKTVSMCKADPAEKRDDDTDIRVYSFNVLYDGADSVPALARSEIVAYSLLYYQPDVVGLSELNEPWHECLPGLIGEVYEFIGKDNGKGSVNCSTLLYNKLNYTVTAQGFYQYKSNGQSPQGRVVVWAVLKNRVSGESFAVTSTHWDHNLAGKESEFLSQQSQLNELAATVSMLRESYGVEVICTGDFNCGEGDINYTDFMSKAGMTDSKYCPGVKLLANYRPYHGSYGTKPPVEGVAADHIFISSGLSSVKFSTVITNETLYASDHCPIYADIIFKD